MKVVLDKNLVSKYRKVKPKTRYFFVIIDGTTTCSDRVNGTMENLMRGGVRERKGQLSRAAKSLYSIRIGRRTWLFPRRRKRLVRIIRVPIDVSRQG
ncbi:hypothetical protein DPMN_172724 [Dreissena polymorpha]|uniref:Uncharacterized protein n=1 Tax=Dreissena polymorpha TaxID=45954 RepID=A0A9D4E458_DREPO|nr:hypothetical protein DPMN_172724 [Dreissena polymorpha]